MRNNKPLFYLVLTLGLFLLIPANYYIFNNVPDNPAEQVAEAIINQLFGINIDISTERKLLLEAQEKINNPPSQIDSPSQQSAEQ
jgi:hypothetical protein